MRVHQITLELELQLKEGIEVDGKVYSPSYAAVYCIQKAGASGRRPTAGLCGKPKKGNT